MLLGVRSAGHVFMPHKYVYPGGRVDAGDSRVPTPVSLRPDVLEKLTRTTTEARARAIAMAAVRETFEETGLVVGRPASLRSGSPGWRPFFETGYAPALDRLDYIARAVTPPGDVRRYNARFFLVDARHVHGELKGNGELEDLHWVSLEKARDLKLSIITRLVLDSLEKRLTGEADWGDAIPVFGSRYGKHALEFDHPS